MSYATTNFSTAKQLLANRLGDTGKVHYLDAELGIAIVEALRTWNSIALYFRDQYSQTLTPSQQTFDIANITDFPGSVNIPTLKDRDLVNALQYNLYELATTNWTTNTPAMTDMFTVADLTLAVQRARDKFLGDTGCVITLNPLTPPSIINGIFNINPFTVDVRRVSWQEDSPNGPWTIVWRSDEFALTSYKPTWQATANAAGVPKSWSVSEAFPIQMQVYPFPVVGPARTVQIWSVSTGDPLNTTTGVKLGIPDDLTWVVKFGALYDLLSRDGQAKDPVRAQYCLQRYQEGVQVARRVWTTIEQAYSTPDGNTLPIGTIDSLDKYKPNWHNTEGTPTSLAMIGPNVFACSKVVLGTFGVTLQVVANAQVPSVNGDFLQVGQDVLQAILDYAAHLVLFKEEGPEFFGSMDGYKNLFEQAQVHNKRLRASAEYFDVLNDRGFLDEKYFKRLKEQAA